VPKLADESIHYSNNSPIKAESRLRKGPGGTRPLSVRPGQSVNQVSGSRLSILFGIFLTVAAARLLFRALA